MGTLPICSYVYNIESSWIIKKKLSQEKYEFWIID